MRDDPRIARVLKRYPKDDIYFDATIDLSGLTIDELRAAFRALPADRDVRPRRLDDFAMKYFDRFWPGYFDAESNDYFMHTYARREFISDNEELGVPSEDGPPSYIPLDPNLKWLAVRPSEDGNENYVGVPKG
jgi:hypothetical protein